MKRSKLGERLSQWSVNSELPTDFKGQVWERIAEADRPFVEFSFDSLFVWLAERLQHRASAMAFLLVAALLGGGLGGIHAVIDSRVSHVKMAETYLQTVDPSRHSLE